MHKPKASSVLAAIETVIDSALELYIKVCIVNLKPYTSLLLLNHTFLSDMID